MPVTRTGMQMTRESTQLANRRNDPAAASRFNRLSQTLRDGVVSAQDFGMARDAMVQIEQNYPTYGNGAEVRDWNVQVEQARYIFNMVRDTMLNQPRYVTEQETQKDGGYRPQQQYRQEYRPQNYGTRNRPVYREQPSHYGGNRVNYGQPRPYYERPGYAREYGYDTRTTGQQLKTAAIAFGVGAAIDALANRRR